VYPDSLKAFPSSLKKRKKGALGKAVSLRFLLSLRLFSLWLLLCRAVANAKVRFGSQF